MQSNEREPGSRMQMYDQVADGLAGQVIKDVFRQAQPIAQLHACLTSPRGRYFRWHLLQAMDVPLDDSAVEKIRIESSVHEYHRHLNMLRPFGLIEVRESEGTQRYVRTALGERAVNALREFERRVTPEAAAAIHSASLGPHSIRFFLRLYGDKGETNWERLEVRFTPAEVGRLSVFLPRVIEAVSAIDKLHESGLLEYRDDNYIYMQPIRAAQVGVCKAKAAEGGALAPSVANLLKNDERLLVIADGLLDLGQAVMREAHCTEQLAAQRWG